MKNLDKYKSLLSGEVEGLLLTSRYSRHYAAEFDIAEGVALVSRLAAGILRTAVTSSRRRRIWWALKSWP